nr:phosphatidylinositol 4-phosphate 5-kinase-like isoform X3 [Lytechinus pictus]
MDELGPEIREMNRTNETLQEDMKGLVDTEAKDRIRDVQMVRQEFTTKYSQLQQQIEAAAQKAAQGGGAPAAAPIPISQKEKLAAGKGGKVDPAALEKVEFLEEELNKQRRKVEEVKESMAKVESSVQTVRVHLTRKVDSETKSRREEIRDLQLVFEEFKDKVEPLLKQIEEEEKEKNKDNDEGGSGKEDGEGDDNDDDKEKGKDDDKSKEDDNNNGGKDDDKKGDDRGGSAGSRK